MKKPTRPAKQAPRPVVTTDLHHVVGGASFIFAPAMKSKGGLDLG